MPVSPVHLRTLHEIARLGSFSRAADSLHLSQPAVSLHVRQLEDSLGLLLLERMGRRAALTRAGAVLLEHGGRALDVAVVTLPVRSRQLVVTPFYTDRLVAIAPPARRRRGPRAFTPGHLAREPLILYERGGTIRQVIEGWFRRGRVTPRVAMELGNGEAIKELVSAGLGPSITSAISVRAEARAGTLRVVPLSPPLVRRLGIIRRRDKPLSPPLLAVLHALQRRASRRARRSRPSKLARGRRL